MAETMVAIQTATTGSKERPTISPITQDVLGECAVFLHDHLDRNRSAAQWSDALHTTWTDSRPNFGFYVRHNGQIVGVICAFYADRAIRGQTERFCNITSWCVLDAYRQQSMRLAMAVVGQPGFHFTDLSPTNVVSGVLQFLKFKPLGKSELVLINVPGMSLRTTVIDKPADIEQTLRASNEAMRRIYVDHADFPWLRHILVGTNHHWCHVIYKAKTLKGLPCARVIYVSDPQLFADAYRTLATYWLMRGFPTTRIEGRFLNKRLPFSSIRDGNNPRLYLSSSLSDADIDNLYSEQMALDL